MDEKFVVIDDNGVEKEMTILLTFEGEEFGKKYVLYFDENDENGEVFASCYDDDGHLFPIESDEEWNLVDEVFESYMSTQEENK